MVKKFDEFEVELNGIVEEQFITDIYSYEGDNEPINESAVEIFHAVMDWLGQTNRVCYDGEIMTNAGMLASYAGSLALTAPIWIKLIKFILVDNVKYQFKNRKLAKAADVILADDKLKKIIIDKLADAEEVKKYKEDNNYKPEGGWSKYFVEALGPDVLKHMMDEVTKEAPEEVSKVVASKLQ